MTSVKFQNQSNKSPDNFKVSANGGDLSLQTIFEEADYQTRIKRIAIPPTGEVEFFNY